MALRLPIFDEEHELFRKTVRSFVEQEIVPHVDEWEARGEIPRRLFRRMGELGFLGIEFPPAYGGAGADLWMSVVLAEELARCRSGGVAFAVMVHTDMSSPWLVRFGTEEQKARWLPAIVRGETVCALAITEPGTGSDMAGIETRARRDGDGWIITGRKTFITNGVYGDLYFVAARTRDQGPRHRQLSQFVVERDTPGLTIARKLEKMGMWASDTAELVLDEVRLPADAVLPGVVGMKGPLSCLTEARYGIVWGAMGAARACFETALAYAKERVQWGRPIAGFQLTQRKLADMAVELNKGMLLALHLGRMKDEGRLRPQQVSMGKLNNVRVALEIAREARGILGANGITLEYPVIRHMNNLESVYTYEGTNEIHTLILGEALTGLRAYDR